LTRPLVLGLRARKAVALWTPARRATSDIVGRLLTRTFYGCPAPTATDCLTARLTDASASLATCQFFQGFSPQSKKGRHTP
jgi:hypothetical protein